MTRHESEELKRLVASMAPRLNEGIYVFHQSDGRINIPLEKSLMHFKEREGITMILEQNIADTYHIKSTRPMAWITLDVHSSLNAVGFTATFSKVLSEKGISCNVVAAFCHDHIFVPATKAEAAMQALIEMSNDA